MDTLVAWRNYATTQAPGSSFFSPAFTIVSASNYYSFVTSNTTGFLNVTGTALNNGQTDRLFTSRQELIQFAKTALGLSGTSLNALNYLTHFTRALEQPSYSPNPNRPTIISPSSPPPKLTSSNNYLGSDNYQGNNDGAGF